MTDDQRFWAYLLWPIAGALFTWVAMGRVVIGFFERLDKALDKWDVGGAN